MCGLAGLLVRGDKLNGPLEHVVRRMIDQLVHRGPDGGGTWSDDAAGVALGHRRLSILDLSPAGHQPMISASSRFVMVFNGEIYNHLEIREELTRAYGNVVWRGHSDTETLLAAVDRWGLKGALCKSVGMFALALWDRQDRALYLASDRAGEKPLYYGAAGPALLFGSETKALRVAPGFDDTINRDALALFMRHNYIPAPLSIFRQVRKLLPGTIARFNERSDFLEPETEVYWSFRRAAEDGLKNPFASDEISAREELDRVLRRSIAGQMVADVPLGAFLSGGIDSSVVVALMQAQSSRPVKTFTIGFHESGFDEATHARAVARHLGTDHTELYVTPRDAINVIPRLPGIYDEPFADSSQIPTFLVASMAREHVTVSLSGDAGDELFGGYNRYFWAKDIWRRIALLPVSANRAFGRLLSVIPQSRWDSIFRFFGPVLPGGLRVSRPGEKVYKLASMMATSSPEAIYYSLLSHWQDPADVVLESLEPLTAVTDRNAWLDCDDFESRMMFLDSITYLPNDILVKVDRAAMAVSLETRVPMLDHRVIEFAWRLPVGMKIRSGEGKWLLRQLLYSHVPRTLIDRPKMGFGVPIGDWLRGPLRDWAEALLSRDRLAREAYFKPEPLLEKWNEHLSGRRDWQYHLWDALMFQAWREHWVSNSS